MHYSIILTALSVFSVSVKATPLSPEQSLDKRSFYGRGTWYYDGEGACGYYDDNYDSVVALSVDLYGSGGHCGQTVTITNTANGETATGTVADRCQGCGEYDLDMSIGLFEQIGELSTGVLSISWYFG